MNVLNVAVASSVVPHHVGSHIVSLVDERQIGKGRMKRMVWQNEVGSGGGSYHFYLGSVVPNSLVEVVFTVDRQLAQGASPYLINCIPASLYLKKT